MTLRSNRHVHQHQGTNIILVITCKIRTAKVSNKKGNASCEYFLILCVEKKCSAEKIRYWQGGCIVGNYPGDMSKYVLTFLALINPSVVFWVTLWTQNLKFLFIFLVVFLLILDQKFVSDLRKLKNFGYVSNQNVFHNFFV